MSRASPRTETEPMTQSAVDGGSRTAALPRPIRRVLGRVGRRLRLAALLRGVGMVALIGTIGALLGMGADFAWAAPPGGALGDLGDVAGGGWHHHLPRHAPAPGAQREPRWRLAAVAERADPRLGERLTGAVALAGPRHGHRRRRTARRH